MATGAMRPPAPTWASASPASRARTGAPPRSRSGLVFVAIDGAAGTRVRRILFPGGRERVRFQATQVALEMLRRGLLGLPPL